MTKKFKNKSQALIEADKILRLIHHYNGKYHHLIQKNYLERLTEKIIASKDDFGKEITQYFNKKGEKDG
tara:strand:- start:1383 stop:1589 length:207 start_codon:yes stop_codon:yes gene_type:complete